jgi:hypothetical protein
VGCRGCFEHGHVAGVRDQAGDVPPACGLRPAQGVQAGDAFAFGGCCRAGLESASTALASVTTRRIRNSGGLLTTVSTRRTDALSCILVAVVLCTFVDCLLDATVWILAVAAVVAVVAVLTGPVRLGQGAPASHRVTRPCRFGVRCSCGHPPTRRRHCGMCGSSPRGACAALSSSQLDLRTPGRAGGVCRASRALCARLRQGLKDSWPGCGPWTFPGPIDTPSHR